MAGVTDPIMRLLLMFERQQYEGCGDDECLNRHCFSYKRLRPPPARRPTRPTARSMAMALGRSPNAALLICPRLLTAPPLDPAGPVENHQYDPNNIEQMIVTTPGCWNAWETRDLSKIFERAALRARSEFEGGIESSTSPVPPMLATEAGRQWHQLYFLDKPIPLQLDARFAPTPYQVTFFRSICLYRMQEATAAARRIRRLAVRHTSEEHTHTPIMSFDDVAIRGLGLVNDRLAANPIQEYQREYVAIEVPRKKAAMSAMQAVQGLEGPGAVRPLRVSLLEDEIIDPAIDLGGVGQEFFHLIFTEYLSDQWDFFSITDSESNTSWFKIGSRESLDMWSRLGTLMALGVQNGYVLPINMPLAFYYKLSGTLPPQPWKVPIEDGWPAMYKQFVKILGCTDNDEVEAMSIPFCYSMDTPSGHLDVDMTHFRAPRNENGLDVSYSEAVRFARRQAPDAPYKTVTNKNKHLFASMWIDWTVNGLVTEQWNNLARGFYSIIPVAVLESISPQALRAVVEGNPELDVDALEQRTTYEGYAKTDRGVTDFWAVVRGFDDRLRRQLLQFVTGTTRLAANDRLEFVISRSRSDNPNRLPTASVCSRNLCLPLYADRATLRERLTYVLESAMEFGTL